MSLTNWKVTGLASVGENWEISINNPAGTSLTGNIDTFNTVLGGGDIYIKLNNGVRKFKSAKPIGQGINDFKILTQQLPTDYYYFPPFVSWDSWTITDNGWRPNTPTVILEVETGTANSTADIYSELPFEWGISGAPASWNVASQSGSLAITGRRTDGSPLVQLESDAFINTFFNSGQYIYISGLQAEVVSNSGLDPIYPVGSVGNARINIKNSKIQPAGYELVDGASIYSTIYSTSTPLNEVYVQGNYPRDSVVINYEFNSGESYSGGAIISSLPSFTNDFSGLVVGNESLTGNQLHRAYFDGESYITVSNAISLDVEKGFLFLFDVEKSGHNPSTIFSNLGPFNNSSVSGWEIGFNSAGYQTFTYYGDYLPRVYTASEAGPARGIYCAGASNNLLSLGRFDFNSLSLSLDSFLINSSFIRNSNDWKIGSGEYVFSGYMDSFLCMDYLPTADMVENIMQSYLYSGFATPPVVRTLPREVTGYTGYCSGTTGNTWFTGVLSGQETGIYTGYNFTATGITGELNFAGTYNLYTSGDLYSGLYIHNPLLWFGLENTDTGYYEVSDPSTYTASSLSWNPIRQTLFTLDKNTSVVTELNRRRKRVRNLSTNLNEAKGTCYMSGDIMAFLDSADPYSSDNASIYYTAIDNSTAVLDTGSMDKIQTTVNGSFHPDYALKGITCDVGRKCFYAVTASSAFGPTLYQIDFDGTSTEKTDFRSLADLGDYSDVHYQAESDSLFIVSSGYPDPSVILQTSLNGEIWYSGNAEVNAAAGLTLANNSQTMYVISSTGYAAGASWIANQNRRTNYEFIEKETGFTSGDFLHNEYIYRKKYIPGLALTGLTGFSTGHEQFTYTGYTDIYFISGLTGSDSNTGCVYNPASGGLTPYEVTAKKEIMLQNSAVFNSYYYDRIALLGNIDAGDFVEIQAASFSPSLQYVNSGYGLYGQNINQQQLDVGELNRLGNYGFNEKVGRPGFYIDSNISLESGANVYLNGIIQQPGELEYRINKNYESIPYVSGGGYAISGSQIFDSGTGFLNFNAITNDVLYADLNQPIETSGVTSQKLLITNTNQYLDPVTMGISGLYNQIFLNGRRLYEGRDKDYVVFGGNYFHATGNITGVTGVLYTIPSNTGLISYTGIGPTVFTGEFLNNNFGALNGVRWPSVYAYPFSSQSTLLSGNQRISYNQQFDLLYNKNFEWPGGVKAFSLINPHYSWTESGVNTGTGWAF